MWNPHQSLVHLLSASWLHHTSVAAAIQIPRSCRRRRRFCTWRVVCSSRHVFYDGLMIWEHTVEFARGFSLYLIWQSLDAI